MHMAIDILAAIVLLFFFLAGWHKGFLLSLLGVVRVVLAYGAAYFAGRYLGFWLGEIAHRPRIVTIPAVAGLTFVLITFIFHIIMSDIRAKHREKEEAEDFRQSTFSCLGGSAINLAAGIFSLALLFWLGDLFMAGATGTSIPGADKACFGRFTRRTVYEVTRRIIPEKDNPLQVASIARLISNPADGMAALEKVVSAESIQQLATDEQLAGDLLSGDAERIQQNASIQRLLSDRATLKELRDLGVLSGHESKSSLCDKLAAFGRNEKVRASIESLKAREMLRADKITLLIRDPEFDVIVAELLR
jgi:hypothetical protein